MIIFWIIPIDTKTNNYNPIVLKLADSFKNTPNDWVEERDYPTYGNEVINVVNEKCSLMYFTEISMNLVLYHKIAILVPENVDSIKQLYLSYGLLTPIFSYDKYGLSKTAHYTLTDEESTYIQEQYKEYLMPIFKTKIQKQDSISNVQKLYQEQLSQFKNDSIGNELANTLKLCN